MIDPGRSLGTGCAPVGVERFDSMKPEWQTKLMEYPNAEYNCLRTSISFGSLGASYYHVEGGFRVHQHYKSAKLYTSESDIRLALLKKLLAEVRKNARQIKEAIEETYF